MEVTYLDSMGDDLAVVNAAKVSNGKRSEWDRRLDHYSENNDTGQWESEGWTFWDESTSGDVYRKLSKADRGLIAFLARGCTSGDWEKLVHELYETGWEDGKKGFHDYNSSTEIEDLLNHIRRMPPHWSPFAHTAVTLHMKMPIFVARQIMKHTTGIEYNEVSRRYVDDDPEFYVPDVWRKRADNVKQGSSDEAVVTDTTVYDIPYYGYEMPLDIYKRLIADGVAPELARIVLPQSMYTEVIATGNLYAWANMYVQRTDSHAQKETQEIAKQIGEIIEPLFPVSWRCLTQ